MEQHKKESFSNTKDTNKKFNETFFARIFRLIIDSGIPIQNILKYIFFGYAFGVISTVIWYNFVSDVKVNIVHWTFFIFMGFLVLILSYSKEVRCTVAVAIPTLFTAKGRSLIIAAAFLLAATGPTLNILRNVDVLVESLTCGQMQLKQALGDMLDTLKQPLVAIKETVRNIIKELKKVLSKVQAILLRISVLISVLLTGIKNAFKWLENVVKICNTEFGTPYERCRNISKIAMQDCLEKLGPVGGLCHLTHIFSIICYPAKVVDVICVMVDVVNYSVIANVMAGLEKFTNEIKEMFDVSVSFEHDFYFQTTYSKELEQIKKDIMSDIHGKLKPFLIIFGWLDIISLILFIIIIFKPIIFSDIRANNLKNYFQINDCRLTKKEWMDVAHSSVFLIISTIQLFCICLTDYSLFWVLAIISFYGHKELGYEVPPLITVEVEGGGFVGEIFRGIVHAFEPMSQNYTIDAKACLPNPSIPNYTNYYLIAIIDVMAWTLLFCQPYGLRLRHIIMRLFYPEVARQRAAWLHNNILVKRISFFKLARRKARLLFGKNASKDNFSFLDWLRSRTERFCICRFLLGRSSKGKCILCGIPLDNDMRVKCETVGCLALYCKNCFRESFEMCCVCNKPVEYGDFSDVSEVEDSSDDSDAVHNNERNEYYV